MKSTLVKLSIIFTRSIEKSGYFCEMREFHLREVSYSMPLPNDVL